MTATLTFADLVKLDSRLADLERYARAVAKAEARRYRYCCGNRAWYKLVKPRLVWLVGFQRAEKHPILSTSAAYDVAYTHLYDLMPDCKECSCFTL